MKKYVILISFFICFGILTYSVMASPVDDISNFIINLFFPGSPSASQGSVIPGESSTTTTTPTTACIQDVQQCPDGSYVGRNPNDNCNFYPCPTQTCPAIYCLRDPCPGNHLPDSNGCINCASPCTNMTTTSWSSTSSTISTTFDYSCACNGKVCGGINCDGVSGASCAHNPNVCYWWSNQTVPPGCTGPLASGCSVDSDCYNKVFYDCAPGRSCPSLSAKCYNNNCYLCSPTTTTSPPCCSQSPNSPPCPPDAQICPTSTVPLSTGWNMFSLPLMPNSQVQINCDQVGSRWHHDPVQGHYVEATSLTAGLAYWIKVRADCALTVAGDPISLGDLPPLHPGWNQIGAPTQPTNFSAGNCQVLSGPWAYNIQTNNYDQATALEPGKGYWVKVSNSCQLSSQSAPEVISIKTSPTSPQVGDNVVFNVTLQNVGSNTIYYIGGCGPALTATADSQHVQIVPGYRCLCASRLTPLNPNGVASVYGPGCGNGYLLKIINGGTVFSNLTIPWGTTPNSLDQSLTVPYSFVVPQCCPANGLDCGTGTCRPCPTEWPACPTSTTITTITSGSGTTTATSGTITGG